MSPRPPHAPTPITHPPTSCVQAPVKKVATLIVSSEVPSAVAASRPASQQMAAMLVAIALKKMRPTSCTWPTAGRKVGGENEDAWARGKAY